MTDGQCRIRMKATTPWEALQNSSMRSSVARRRVTDSSRMRKGDAEHVYVEGWGGAKTSKEDWTLIDGGLGRR